MNSLRSFCSFCSKKEFCCSGSNIQRIRFSRFVRGMGFDSEATFNEVVFLNPFVSLVFLVSIVPIVFVVSFVSLVI